MIFSFDCRLCGSDCVPRWRSFRSQKLLPVWSSHSQGSFTTESQWEEEAAGREQRPKSSTIVSVKFRCPWVMMDSYLCVSLRTLRTLRTRTFPIYSVPFHSVNPLNPPQYLLYSILHRLVTNNTYLSHVLVVIVQRQTSRGFCLILSTQ